MTLTACVEILALWMLRKKIAALRQVARNPLAGSAAVIATANYLAAGLGLLTAAISARLLDPSDYGLAALAIAYPSLIWSVTAIKSEAIGIRYLSQFRTTGQGAMALSICKLGYGVDLLSSLVAVGIISATAGWVADSLFHHSELTLLMVAYGLLLPLRALGSTSIAVFISWEQFRWTAIAQLLDKFMTLVCVAGSLLAGFGVPGMVLATALVQAAVGLGLAIGANYVLTQAGLGSWLNSSLKRITNLKQELREFIGWSYLTTTFAGLAEQIPLILLGRLRGPEEAGFFRLASSLMTVASYVEGALGRVTYPRLSARWVSGSGNSLRGSILRWTTWAGVPVTICLLAIIPLLPGLVRLVFGNSYTPMVTGGQIMVGAAAFSTMFFWVSPLYYAAGMVRSWAQGYAVYTAGLLALAWWATSTWGFLGMAVVSGVMKAMFSIAMASMILKPEELNREAVSAARPGRS